MKRIATALVALVAIAPLALTGCMKLLLSGGPSNIVRNLKPAPDVNGRALTRKRLAATKEAEAALQTVDGNTGFTSYGTSTDDRCYKGDNEFMMREGYAHRCRVRITRFYGMGNDFWAQMLGLEDLLATNGWQMPRSRPGETPSATFRDVFENYYARFCRGQRIAIFGASPVDAPSCEMSKLPRSRSDGYRKGGATLWIEFAEHGETLYMNNGLYVMDLMQKVDIGGQYKEHDRKYNLYQKTDLQDVKAQFQNITASHQYIVAVTVEETYFEN